MDPIRGELERLAAADVLGRLEALEKAVKPKQDPKAKDEPEHESRSRSRGRSDS